MIKVKSWYLVTIVSFISFHLSYSQDTLEIEGDQVVDTVVIYKDPLVVKKTVYVYEEAKKRKKEIWIEIAASSFYTQNKYIDCPGYEIYLTELKKSTKPLLGYHIGANVLRFYNNFLLSTGIGYTSFREKLSYQSPTTNIHGINIHNYISIPFTIGYRVINTNKFQTMLSTGAIAGKLLSIKGQTNSEEDFTIIKDINEVRKYYEYTCQGIFKIKLVYDISEMIYIGLEPFFSTNLISVTKSKEPFTQYRSNIGVSANLILAVK
jgi:hypothetical protein